MTYRLQNTFKTFCSGMESSKIDYVIRVESNCYISFIQHNDTGIIVGFGSKAPIKASCRALSDRSGDITRMLLLPVICGMAWCNIRIDPAFVRT